MSEDRILTFPDPGIANYGGTSVTINFPPGEDGPTVQFELGGEYPAGSVFHLRGKMALVAGSLSANCGGDSASLGSGATFDQTVTLAEATDVIALVGEIGTDGQVSYFAVDLVSP